MWNYLRVPILMLAMVNSLSYGESISEEVKVKGYDEKIHAQKDISDLDPVKQDTTLIGPSLDIYEANIKQVDTSSTVYVNDSDESHEVDELIVENNEETQNTQTFEKEDQVQIQKKEITTKVENTSTKKEPTKPSLVSRLVNSAANTALYIPKKVAETVVKVQDYVWKKADDGFHFVDNKRKRMNKSSSEFGAKVENKAKKVVATGLSMTPAGLLLNYADRKLANNDDDSNTSNKASNNSISENELIYMIDHTKIPDLMEMIGKQEQLLSDNNIKPAYLLESIRNDITHDKLKELYLLNNEKITQAGLAAIHEMNDISNIADASSDDHVDINSDFISDDQVSISGSETDSVTCAVENDTVLGLQTEIASLKSSLDSMNENFQTLMQTMTMNNLIMSQNNLLMSQMMLNNNMQNQYYGANPAGEKKSSFDDIVDQHYQNYKFQYEGAYNPFAVNQTPFTSNYQPQTSFQMDPNATQSESFFQTGPLNAGYSPGYNFSFGNVYDQSRTNAWTVGSTSLPRQLL